MGKRLTIHSVEDHESGGIGVIKQLRQWTVKASTERAGLAHDRFDLLR